MSLTDAQKEKIKLRATFLNGLATGSVLIGVLTPVTRAAYDPSVTGSAFVLMAITAAVCFVLGFGLHFIRVPLPRKVGPVTIYNYLLLAIPVLGVVALVFALHRQDDRAKHPHPGE